MSELDQSFFDNLTNDLKPGRHWSPLSRTLAWAISLFLLNIIGLLAYQSFRPGFLNQLLESSRFSVEMVSGVIFVGALTYLCFVSMVPGRRYQQWFWPVFAGSLLTWAGSLVLSFYQQAPAASPLGARAYCVEEVAFYGLLGAFSFLIFAHKSDFRYSFSQYLLMGITAGFIPGFLMQLACMYSPKHGLILHYAPAIIIGLLASASLPLLRGIFKK